MQGLTPGPYHIKLAGCLFLPVPRPVVAQCKRPATFGLVHTPERARCSHDETERIGPQDALPPAALILPQPIEGVGVANGNFHGPAVTIPSQDVVGAQRQIGGEKGFKGRGRVSLPRPFGRAWTITSQHHDPYEAPGNTECHRPHQACISAPASLGCGNHPWEVCTRVFGEPIQAPFLRGAPRRFVVGVGGNVSSAALMGKRPTAWAVLGN